MEVEEMELVWDKHLLTLRELFNSLYKDSVLVDVTLSCQGGFLRAHKLVLSACSSYFKQVFQENPCKHPTIVLRSIKYTDMAKLLEYMYRGCISVPTDHFEEIVQVALDLKIKGFETYRNGIKPIVQQDEISESGEAVVTAPTITRDTRFKGQKRVNVIFTHDYENHGKTNSFAYIPANPTPAPQNEIKIKEEGPTEGHDESMSDNEDEDENEDKTNHRIEATTISKIVTLFECDVCSRRFKSRKDLQKHKKIHQDKTFSCEFCSKLFSRASHLIRHRRVHTGERPFVCDTCGKDFARQDKLKLHIRTTHGGDDIVREFHANVEVNIGTVEAKTDILDDEEDSDSEMQEHITLENLVPNSNYISSKKEKRGRGRPRKYPICEIFPHPKRGRGRPRKDDYSRRDSSEDNYDITSLPYGDISYLTMPLEQGMTIEPLVEINTDTNTDAESTQSKVFENGESMESTQKEPESPEAKETQTQTAETNPNPNEVLKTIGKIGECTISIN